MNITGQLPRATRVLEPSDMQTAANSAKAGASPGISVSFSVQVDRAVIADALQRLPAIINQSAPAVGDAAAKVIGTMSDKAQQQLAKGAVAAFSMLSARVGQATDKVVEGAVNTVTAPMRGARAAARLGVDAAKFGASVLFGRSAT